ncbi:MAG TPA: type II toxin-antitoxin system RelE/ParE family toxin [Nitrospirales bacterium]|nr:type II toxin-antitoxin system RelE/ParE family toxin [Nitrospirales bacterium]
MSEYQLSKKADQDLERIYEYSIKQFGENVADEYFLSLRDCLLQVADSPKLGRDCSNIVPEHFRFECGPHSIFFKEGKKRIVIVRVIHQSMNPDIHI